MTDHPRIGVWLTRTDPYWVQINEAVFLRGRQLSADMIPFSASMEFSEQSEPDQERLVEDILSYGLSVLIATYISKQAALRILETGLPIIHLTETNFTHPNLVAFNGYYDCALLAGQYVAERMNGKGQALVIGGLWEKTGERGASRVTAIADVFKNYPNLSWQHIPAPWAYEQACPVIEKALQNMPKPIDALIGISDPLALATRDVGNKLGIIDPYTTIVGINGDPLALAAVADGSMTATVETNSANFGREAMEIAYALALGQSSQRSLSIQSTVVTPKNVGELALKKLISIADIPSRLVGINREAEQYRIKQFEIVTSINKQIGGLLDQQKLLRQVAELIGKHYFYDRVDVYHWDDSKQLLCKEYPVSVSRRESQLPLEQAGILGEIVRNGEPIFIPDSRHSLQYAPDPAYPQTRSRAILPIRFNQKVTGVIDLHSSRRVKHFRHELLGLQLMADQLGIAAQNASLYEQSVQARATAEKANQLKTRLLANVSHELRTPINVILGYTQVALKEPNIYGVTLPDELRRDQQQIYKSGEHLVRLINDLLDMSRLEIGVLDLNPEILAPQPFLEEVFNSMADYAPRPEVVWRLDLPESLPLIQVDPVRLRQILFNLLSNAHKFTTQGEICLGADVQPPHLHLWVRDTGMGIPSEAQEQIFEPFSSVENLQRRPDGIGLGLSITRRLVALHNGSMSLESGMGAGSTFHIYLPLPGLDGLSMVEPDEAMTAMLLLISHHPDPSPAILQLCQRRGLSLERITSADDVHQLRHPAVLAWDMGNAHPADWVLISQLRRSPLICRLPFVVYNQSPGASGLTNVLVKPVAQTTLLEMLDSLQPGGADDRPVLVVDDDAQTRDMYRRLVAEALPGVPVQSVADGQFALDRLETVTPCLVLLDLMMPRVDGFTVLAHMRANPRLQTVPVLVMSGKLLTEEDAQRLDYARVVFRGKDLLSAQEALDALQATMKGEGRLPQATSVVVKQTIAYLHQHYAELLKRQQIAQAVGVSERYLSEIFKQEMGISPWEVLNRFRIQRAIELLKNTDKSITEIAMQVGFNDSSYFGRVFQKQVGVSPTKYRSQ